MLVRLILLLVFVPLADMTVLLLLADVLGFQTTLLMIVASGLLGAWLLKRQGLQVFRRIRAELAAGKLPALELLDAMLIVMAGALLLTPGVLTDVLGIALLIPLSRSWFRRWLVRWMKARWQLTAFSNVSATQEPTRRSSEIIDSYVVRSGEEKNNQ